jgi:hypothetical protein
MMKSAACVAAGIVLMASLAVAADDPEKVSTRNYALKPLFKSLYPANAGVEDRPMRGPDEPIGFVRKPGRDDESTVYLAELITAHLEQPGWKSSGGTTAEVMQAVGDVIEIRAPASMHKNVERFLNALAKPAKFNPKATADELTAAAVYVSEEMGTITLVYGLAPFPARVCGENVTNRTSRVQVISALMERVYDNVSPGKWQNKGHRVGTLSELAGRIILTAPAETHVELAQKMQEWTKR